MGSTGEEEVKAKSNVVLVCGESGVGKTTVASQLADWLGEKAAVVSQDHFFCCDFVDYCERVDDRHETPGQVNWPALLASVDAAASCAAVVLVEGHAVLCSAELRKRAALVLVLCAPHKTCAERRLGRSERSPEQYEALKLYLEKWVGAAHTAHCGATARALLGGKQYVRTQSSVIVELDASEPMDEVVRACRREVATMLLEHKFDRYFDAGFAPWDSGFVCSQLVSVLASGHFEDLRVSRSGARLSSLELGCGTGASTCWLAAQGLEAVGVDICKDAVGKSQQRAAAQLVSKDNPRFVCADVFRLPLGIPDNVNQAFDFVFDSQCFHCLREIDERAVVEAMVRMMAPGALMLVLTGNDNEPYVGPAVVSKGNLINAFVHCGGLQLVSVVEGRFDATPAYAELKRRPLAWVALFRKPPSC